MNDAIRSFLGPDALSHLRQSIFSYPEMRLLIGPATASPEGPRTLPSGSWSEQAFFPAQPSLGAVEAERTLAGLAFLRSALLGERERFPKLSEERFAHLRAWISPLLDSIDDLRFVHYSLACNDLGKTQPMEQLAEELFPGHAMDHDQLLAAVVQNDPERFEGLRALPLPQRTAYAQSLSLNLNLGQLVQGECLPESLAPFFKLDPSIRRLRLIAELFDFAGAAGHVQPQHSLLLGDEAWLAFHLAIETLNASTEPHEAYRSYIAGRARQAMLPDLDAYPLGRLAAMARVFDPRDAQAIQASWGKLSTSMRAELSHELHAEGSNPSPGILLYYAPAAISSAARELGSLELAMDACLMAFHLIFERARHELPPESLKSINVAFLARSPTRDWPELSARAPLGAH